MDGLAKTAVLQFRGSLSIEHPPHKTAANANLVENVKMMRPESIAEMMLVSMMLKESANQLSNYHILRFVQKNEL